MAAKRPLESQAVPEAPLAHPQVIRRAPASQFDNVRFEEELSELKVISSRHFTCKGPDYPGPVAHMGAQTGGCVAPASRAVARGETALRRGCGGM